MRLKRNPFLWALLVLIQWNGLAQKTLIKVACIGDSVTAGLLLTNPTSESYPAQLQLLMGENYEVKNFGLSGATLLKKGSKPYCNSVEFAQALSINPDIAIIHLGLNDTDPRNWPNYKGEFDYDYTTLIESLKNQNPVIKIFICMMTPIFNEHRRFKSGTRDWYWQIQDHISPIAKANNVGLIDLHDKLYSRPDIFPDALHPTPEGASIIAKTVYESITQDYGGLKLPLVFSNNMVMQRDKPITVYGWANGGDPVEVGFNQQKKVAITDSFGKWKVSFSPLSKGGPYKMTVKCKDKKIVFDNILMGDVWFCSGQSNMAFELQKSKNGNDEVKQSFSNTKLRFFNSKNLRETDDTAWDSITLAKTNRLQFFSGTWTVCDTVTAKDFSAIAYYFGKKITIEEDVPIGLIQLAVGGSPIESWIDRYTLEHDDKVVDGLTNWRKSDFFMPWVRERADTNLKKATIAKQRHPYDPCYNFEAGVKNFVEFPIKGVLWYQGESNAHNIDLYEHLLPTLVQSWRKAWQSNFPFYYVQLSSINRPSWPEFRDMQNRLLKQIPNSNMAISMDYGDSLNVHPVHKKEVANRLALLALRDTYKKPVKANGPKALNAIQKNEQIVVSFYFAEQLSTVRDKKVIGFELVTEKGKYIEPTARIAKNQVFISIPKGEKIKSVLYGWKPYTDANLVNEVGLPCSTFKLEVN